jgi:hypothetical protein
VVDLFARPARSDILQRIWRFYAVGGVRVRLIFNEHLDFTRMDLVPALAVEIEKALARAEMRSSCQAETNADLPALGGAVASPHPNTSTPSG